MLRSGRAKAVPFRGCHGAFIMTHFTACIVTVAGEDLPPEEAGPSEEPLPDDDSFLVASDQEDRFETPEHEMVSEGRTRFLVFRIRWQ